MLEEVAHNRQQSFRLPQYPATATTKDPHGRLPRTATSRSWERGRAAETSVSAQSILYHPGAQLTHTHSQGLQKQRLGGEV